MNISSILKVVLPIALCALIGYGTNYIAIKMLFRPKKAIRIGNFKLPFTPGVIPKNQPRIARAVGNAVGNNLLTRKDILGVFEDPELKEKLIDKIAEGIQNTEFTMQEAVKKETVTELVTTKICAGIDRMDIPGMVMELAIPVLVEKVSGTMLAMFLSTDKILSFAAPIADELRNYIDEHGRELIEPIVEEEVGQMMEMPVPELLKQCGIGKDEMKEKLSMFYDKLVSEKAEEFLGFLDISKVVEDKVNEMKVEDLEELVMSVMKQELQAVINLGALIGAVIGVINVFI